MAFRTLLLREPDSFEQTLLWAQDMASLASATLRHFENLGARNAKLIWHTALSDPNDWQSMPAAALADSELILIRQARKNGDYAEKITAEVLHVAILLTGQQHLWACLCVELDAHASDPRQQKQWQESISKLALRSQSVLQTERLRVDVDRLARAERLQRSLFAISDLANSDKETHEVLHDVHQIVGRLMYAENFYIVRYDRSDQTLRFIYFADIKDRNAPIADQRINISDMPNSLTLAMLRHAKPIHGPSAEVIKILNVKLDAALGPASIDWLGVPMLDHGNVVGGVVVQSYDTEHRYTDEDQALLAYVAQHILTALERRGVQEELEKRVDERTQELQQEVAVRQRGERLQRALFRIAEVSQRSINMEGFYASVHKIVGELLHAKNFYIALLSDDKKQLVFPYTADERDIVRSQREIGRGLTEYVIRTAKPALLNRHDIDELELQGEVTVTGTKSVSWMGVPLFLSGAAKGVIALQSYTEDYHYAELDKELVSFVAVHIASALERRLTDETLHKAYAELERRVSERTHELAQANNELRDQILVRERVELKLKHETMHDALTGLPNRSHLLGRLGRALGRYHNDASHLFAVLFLDLDRFKIVNDSVGHLVGDELLREAAKRISSCVRDPDLVARLGGDEFAVVLENIMDQDDVTVVADRIIRTLSAPMRIAGKELFTSASIGIAIVDALYRNPEELLRDADVAMYRAKAKGRKRYALFDEGLHEVALKTMDLENDLRRAIQRHEFLPYYQPIAQLIDGKVIGFEALMRWQHPERGLLAPGDFLAVAEETGNLEAMDWQIYEQVCIDLSALVVTGAYVTLNVSPVHLRDKTFAERFLALMERHQVKPQGLRLEVTEGALLEDPEQVASCLLMLKQLGVHTVLDDFGTGYSSLSYLHRFPLSGLKVDRSFVNALREGEVGGSTAIVRAIRLMADSLGLDVIAEGIETEDQRQQLRLLGLTLGQGYLFARPASLNDVCEKHIFGNTLTHLSTMP
jgi:diguanylate cyclase (GGDEF)-like protein